MTDVLNDPQAVAILTSANARQSHLVRELRRQTDELRRLPAFVRAELRLAAQGKITIDAKKAAKLSEALAAAERVK